MRMLKSLVMMVGMSVVRKYSNQIMKWLVKMEVDKRKFDADRVYIKRSEGRDGIELKKQFSEKRRPMFPPCLFLGWEV